jgi:perosamine synthetase
MSFAFRYLAPAGSPVSTVDLLRWCGTAFAATPAPVVLAQTLRQRLNVGHVFFTSTGRAGMTILLQAMRGLSAGTRTEVVIPSYTCYSVPASVVKAGLRPRIVDIDPVTLDFDRDVLERTDFSRVLAVIATNLYGLPNDLPALQQLTRRHGAFLIDDAAQALGARVGGRWSGTWGDAGLFSFDKGKNVAAIDGGIVVTSSEPLAAALRDQVAGLEPARVAASTANVVKALAYFALLRPWLYGIPARTPQLQLGRTIFTTDFPLAQADPTLLALGLTMLNRVDEFLAARRANARGLIEELRGADVTPIAPRADAEPAYLRLPILARSAEEQRAAIRSLTRAGIGATGSYPSSIADLDELQPYLTDQRPAAGGGRSVAQRIVTLPTHPFVTSRDIRRIAMTLEAQRAGVAGATAYTAR